MVDKAEYAQIKKNASVQQRVAKKHFHIVLNGQVDWFACFHIISLFNVISAQ